MGDFNINILNCDSDKDTTDFIDTMMHSHYIPPSTLLQELQQPQKL